MTAVDLVAEASGRRRGAFSRETLLSDTGDSLDLIATLQEIERRENVTLPNDAIAQLVTVGDLADLIEAHR